MKKTLSLILCAAMLLGVLAGCGSPEPEETTAATTEGTTASTPATDASTTEATTAPATETSSTAGSTSDTAETTLGTVIMTRTEATTSETTEPPQTSATEGTTTEATTPSTTTEATTTPPATEAPETTAPKSPITGEVQTINGVLTVGDCAMEYFYASYDGLRSYAGYINSLQSYLPNVNFYAMFIPIAISMYCPEGVSPGSNQQTVMNDWYAMMPGVTGVDTYSSLYAHRDEYLYFRTDTHWTQRGGYYAYKAFCDASGFSANPLSAYEYASSTGYLGYMYVILKGTSVGNLMSANPDTVEKFKPVSSLSATGYYDPSMTGGGYGVSVVNMDSGNYYAFTGGDQPLIHIKNSSVSNGRIAIVTKDSYGNTLVPFLADCFEELYVIDQRHFNTDSTYSLNIVSFAQSHGVTDFIVEANAFNASAASSNFGRMLP
ncbi:MAG: hypothetical protein II350_05890 [Clostridia bacterium]|nr:hypothetical protein [Clostridia bacterium]